MPATLTTFAAEAIEKMLGTLPKEPTREELEQCGVALADAFRGHLFVAVFEYLDRDAMHLMSDEQALGVLRLLGERYAAPGSGWTGALRSALVLERHRVVAGPEVQGAVELVCSRTLSRKWLCIGRDDGMALHTVASQYDIFLAQFIDLLE